MGQKCASLSIRNIHLGILIIVLNFRFLFVFIPVLVFLIPCSKRESREADGDQRDLRDRKKKGLAGAMAKP